MTNAQLIVQLQTLDPNGSATVSIKQGKETTHILPVVWIAKNSLYIKMPEVAAQVVAAPKPF